MSRNGSPFQQSQNEILQNFSKENLENSPVSLPRKQSGLMTKLRRKSIKDKPQTPKGTPKRARRRLSGVFARCTTPKLQRSKDKPKPVPEIFEELEQAQQNAAQNRNAKNDPEKLKRSVKNSPSVSLVRTLNRSISLKEFKNRLGEAGNESVSQITFRALWITNMMCYRIPIVLKQRTRSVC